MRLAIPWHWPLVIALALYLVSGAVVVMSRIRYERRRRLLARVEEAVSERGPDGLVARRPGTADPFMGVSSGSARRFAFEARVPRAVNEMVAHFIVATIGSDRLARTASGQGRRVSRWKRIAALRVLALGASPDALPALDAALRDADTEIVAAAAAALGSMSDPSAGVLLVRALERGYYSASRLATFLERFPLLMPESLRPLINGATPTVRYWGAVLCRRYRGLPWIEEEVFRLAGDEAPVVRKAALQSLAVLRGHYAALAASRALSDATWFVRAHAARALGELGVHEKAGDVTMLLADREWWVRQAAKDALAQMGEGAQAAVVACLSHPDRFARNSAAEILQDTGAFERLLTEAVLGSGRPDGAPILRRACAAGGPRLVRAVVDRLPEELRPQAVSMVTALGGPEAVS